MDIMGYNVYVENVVYAKTFYVCGKWFSGEWDLFSRSSLRSTGKICWKLLKGISWERERESGWDARSQLMYQDNNYWEESSTWYEIDEFDLRLKGIGLFIGLTHITFY